MGPVFSTAMNQSADDPELTGPSGLRLLLATPVLLRAIGNPSLGGVLNAFKAAMQG
jgi:hypothetical protein